MAFAIGCDCSSRAVDRPCWRQFVANIDEIVAAAASFLVANSLHYGFARSWIFRDTRRGVAKGYGYFLANAGLGLCVMLLLFVGLTRWTARHYLVAPPWLQLSPD